MSLLSREGIEEACGSVIERQEIFGSQPLEGNSWEDLYQPCGPFFRQLFRESVGFLPEYIRNWDPERPNLRNAHLSLLYLQVSVSKLCVRRQRPLLNSADACH